MTSRGCAYRGDNGNKCAIGHLIDDETAAEWDSQSASGILAILTRYQNDELKGEKPEWLNDDNVLFLMQMQRAHDHVADDASFVRDFVLYTNDIAKHEHLEMPDLLAME